MKISFKEGKQYKYDGDRSKEDMVRFLYEYDQSKKALDLPDYESFKLKKEKDIEKSKIRKAQRGIISKILVRFLPFHTSIKYQIE